jgi:dTDP-4-amino-4,6-dideoxygalactose transaminase
MAAGPLPETSQTPPATPPEIRVPIARPQLGRAEADAVARVVRSRWVLQGPEVAAFENELGAAVGASHAVAVSSGTAALELSLRALGVGPGDEVVTVSHSFIATANVVVATGARPVFVDVERDTFGLDPTQLEAAISPRCKAILCVHQLGFPCDLGAILAIAGRHGLPVVEDAACALGSEIMLEDRWDRIGRPHGLMACFSFHPRKIITTGDGGMITTADASLATRLRSLRQHAMSVAPADRDRDPLARESFLEPAYNYRMTDLSAAIGRPQLARLDAFMADRRRLAASFSAALVDHPVLMPVVERPNVRANWQSYPTLLRPGALLNQDQVLRFFIDRGIACRRGLTNAHQEPAYATRDNWRGGPLPVSEELRDTTVMLPIFQGMTKEEERLVRGAIQALREV